MAIITNIDKIPDKDITNSILTVCEANYNTGKYKGVKYARIQTYGSDERQKKGKQSQVLHIDENIARQLVDLLKNTFDI